MPYYRSQRSTGLGMTSISALSGAGVTRVATTLSGASSLGSSEGANASNQISVVSFQPVPTTLPDISQAPPIKQFRAIALVSQDTQALVGTVTSAFTGILAQRPDLAAAQFDFVSEEGKLTVVSNELSDSDRKWLEDQLNGDTTLVNQMRQFNTDMVSAYDGTQQVAVSGTSLRETGQQYQDVADAIDGSVKFLSLINQVANKAGQSGWFKDATYTDENGGAIDLAKARATSLAGMIDTGRQLEALVTGSIVTHLGNGQTVYGVSNPGVFLSAGPFAATGLSAALVPSAGSSGWSLRRTAKSSICLSERLYPPPLCTRIISLSRRTGSLAS